MHKPAPVIRLGDIRGFDRVKAELAETVKMQNADAAMTLIGITPPRFVVLHGNDGTSPQQFACALAGELADIGFEYLFLSADDVMSRAEGMEKTLTDALNELLICEPAVMIIDNIERVCPRRGDAASKRTADIFEGLMTELLSAPARFVVIGVSRDIAESDGALLDIADRAVEIPLPDESARRSYFMKELSALPCEDGFIDDIVNKTEGMTNLQLRRECEKTKLALYRRITAIYRSDEEIKANAEKIRYTAEELKNRKA